MIIDRDKVTELLKKYPSYKYAVRQYETHVAQPAAGIANYSGIRSGSGASEFFFDSIGKVADFGNKSFKDHLDYVEYKEIVDAIEGALVTLSEDERAVIELKWMRGITLRNIEKRRHYGVDYAKKIHRRALEKMAICLRFVDVPEIEHIPVA